MIARAWVFLRVICIALVLIATADCSNAERILTDETGRTVQAPDHPHRIICLVPNITDSVFAIGASNDVIAVSDYVKYPAEARSKPSVGSITDPSLETIAALRPDLVLGTPVLNSQPSLDGIQRLGVPVYLVDPHGVSGILQSIISIGHATNRDAEASRLVDSLKKRIAAVHARVAGKPAVQVLMPIWYDPIFAPGKGAFVTDIIALAGGRSITDDIDQEWPQISLETVIARAPEALLMKRGGSITLNTLRVKPGWNVLPAVRNQRIYYVDDRVELPSPVAIDALEELARQFHP